MNNLCLSCTQREIHLNLGIPSDLMFRIMLHSRIPGESTVMIQKRFSEELTQHNVSLESVLEAMDNCKQQCPIHRGTA